jgi:hypothetical protein
MDPEGSGAERHLHDIDNRPRDFKDVPAHRRNPLLAGHDLFVKTCGRTSSIFAGSRLVAGMSRVGEMIRVMWMSR